MPAAGTLPAAFGRASEGAERPGRAVLADFLHKVLKLAALRLADLCDRLDFEPLDRHDVLMQVGLLHSPAHSLVCLLSGTRPCFTMWACCECSTRPCHLAAAAQLRTGSARQSTQWSYMTRPYAAASQTPLGSSQT